MSLSVDLILTHSCFGPGSVVPAAAAYQAGRNLAGRDDHYLPKLQARLQAFAVLTNLRAGKGYATHNRAAAPLGACSDDMCQESVHRA